MIGTQIIEELVQSVALTHMLKGQTRVSLLLIAAPESGKTTISTAATCKHVCKIAMITGRSILKQMKDHPQTEFLLFNDMSAVRAMSSGAVNLMIVLLNQITQGETGIVAFAGKDVEQIERPIGIIGCIPFETFTDHRARWKELGFVSRMLPFAYSYSEELVAEIKNTIDRETHVAAKAPRRAMPKSIRKVTVQMAGAIVAEVRRLADARAKKLGQSGIRLLKNYHSIIRAHALLEKRTRVTGEDMKFLRNVDRFVSHTHCTTLDSAASQKITHSAATTEVESWPNDDRRPKKHPRKKTPISTRFSRRKTSRTATHSR